jgi:small subunit ribosomal protein S9
VTERDERDIARPENGPTETPAEGQEVAAEVQPPATPAPEDVAPEAAPPEAVAEPEAVDAAPADAPAADEAPADEPPAEEPGTEQPGTEEPAATPAAEAEPRSVADLAADARYTATGKRKSSVARVIVMPGTGQFRLNGRPLEVYFPRRTHQVVVQQPLETAGYTGAVDVVARIHGGGISGQADAVRHGIAKALIEADPALRGELKRRQLLTRDPRVKERRKAGLKKARKRPQFSKR